MLERPVPRSCEWCGKLVACYDGKDRALKAYEIQRDDHDRLLKDFHDNWILSGEHLCRVRCSNCGKAIIIESGSLFERPDKIGAFPETERNLHKCR